MCMSIEASNHDSQRHANIRSKFEIHLIRLSCPGNSSLMKVIWPHAAAESVVVGSKRRNEAVSSWGALMIPI